MPATPPCPLASIDRKIKNSLECNSDVRHLSSMQKVLGLMIPITPPPPKEKDKLKIF
jgi:hypothetical protein